VLTRKQMIRMIEEAGRVPVERDSLYNEVLPLPEEPMQSGRILIPLEAVH
jgi:hypothetical protein